ncbi:MAG: SEC-C domain-containing protein [Actinobacteria bacterium]|nr:SEC-C domain-containing protein [Actinomycetota bacterium]
MKPSVLTGTGETLHAIPTRRRDMLGPGRNQPCPCGSGRKTKRCCGQQRGPAADQLARAYLAARCREAIDDLADLSEDALDLLSEDLIDLPSLDYSLLVTLPTLINPDLQRLREAVQDDDPDWGWDALTAVAKQIDTPQQRARLADAIISLRGQQRIGRRQAAYALLDLNTPSTRLIGASLLKAVAVSVGAHRTPGGLRLAA